MSIAEWAGKTLGTRTVTYIERDAILYALAVGAQETQIDLVFEDQLRVLPTFGLTLAQWAPDILAEAGVFDEQSVHGAQSLTVHSPLPRSGEVTLEARVGNVWDKGGAALVEVIVECEFYTATWSIYCPGKGGFGGERGPKTAATEHDTEPTETPLYTFPTQAALYRLTGDFHHIHIDPEASAKIGQPKPILQGLCTIAAAVLAIADRRGVHPADLSELEGRFSGMVVPGDELAIQEWDDAFEVTREGSPVISAGRVRFS